MTWIAVLTMFAGMFVCAWIFERGRRQDTDPMRERLAELEVRLADALPEGDPYRSKVLPMLATPNPRVYCEDCRFKGEGVAGPVEDILRPGIKRNLCLAQPDKGLYPLLGHLNKNHDCPHFQKRERT